MFLILGGLSRTVSPTKRPRSGIRSLERRPQTVTPDPSRWLGDGDVEEEFFVKPGDGRRSELSALRPCKHNHHDGRPHSACPCLRRHSFHVTQPASTKSNVAPLSTLSDSENNEHHKSRRPKHYGSSIMDDKQENATAEQTAGDGDHQSTSTSSTSSSSSSSSSSTSSSPTASRSGSPGSNHSPTSPVRTRSSSHHSSPASSKSRSRSRSRSPSHHSQSRSSSSSNSIRGSNRSSSGSRSSVRGNRRSPQSPARSRSTSHSSEEGSPEKAEETAAQGSRPHSSHSPVASRSRVHESFDAAEDEDKDVVEPVRPETATPTSRSKIQRQTSGHIEVTEDLVREPSPMMTSPKEGDGTPVQEYVSPLKHAADERPFSFISAHEPKVPHLDVKRSRSSGGSGSSSSSSSSSSGSSKMKADETGEKANSDGNERESSSSSSSSTHTTPREEGGHRVAFSDEVGGVNSSTASSSGDHQRISSVELPGMRSDDDHGHKHSSYGESPIERPPNPDLLHGEVPPVAADDGQPPSPSGSAVSSSTLSSSAPVAAFVDKTNRYLEKALSSGGTASLVAERILGVNALISRSKEDITPTPSSSKRQPQPIFVDAPPEIMSSESESGDAAADVTPKLGYDSGYSVPSRQPYSFGDYRSSSNYDNAGYLPTRSPYLTSSSSRRFPQDSMRDETTSSTAAAAAPIGERRASNEYTSYLKQADRNDPGDSGSSILDGPVGNGLFSKSSANKYDSYIYPDASAKMDYLSASQPSSTSALQQIKRDAEQRERNIANWIAEARRVAPSSSATSDIEDLRERNQIFREALRVMSSVTSRELDELRNRSMRLDCEMIRLEGDLRSVGFRLDSECMQADDGQEQQQQQTAPPASSYRSKYTSVTTPPSAPPPAGSSKSYGQITNPSILEATMAVEALATKYFGGVGGIPTFGSKSSQKEQPQESYNDEPPSAQPCGDGYVRTLLNRISELEHRVHELSDARTTTERRLGEVAIGGGHMSRAAAVTAGSGLRGSSAQAPTRRISPDSSSRHRQTSADMWPVIRQLEEKLDVVTKKTLNEEEMFVIRDLLKRLRDDKATGSPRPPLSGSFPTPTASATLPRRTRSPSPLTTSLSSRGFAGSGYQKRDLSAGGAGRRVSPQRASSLADWLHQPSGLGEPLMSSQTRQLSAAVQGLRTSLSSQHIANSIRAQAIDRPAPACLVATGYPAPLTQATAARGRSISPPQIASRAILRTARLSPVMSGQRPSSPSQILGDNFSAISDDRPNSPYYASLGSKYAAQPAAPKADTLSNCSQQQLQQPLGAVADNVTGKRPFVPRSANDVRLGDVIKFTRQGGRVARGVVRYVGHLPGREEVYLGVELEAQDGKHDGTYEGKRYFKCKPNKGVFVAFNKVVIAWGDA